VSNERPEAAGARRVLAAVAADPERLASAVARELRSQVPAYAEAFTEASLMTASFAALELVSKISDAGELDDEVRDRLAAAGARRAQDGVPLEDMFRAWHLAIRVVARQARLVAAEIGAPASDAAEAVDIVLATTDAAISVAACAHREAELASVRSSAEQRSAFVAALLTGKVLTSARAQASATGLDPSRHYVAVRVVGIGSQDLDRLAHAIARRPEQRGLPYASAVIDGHLGLVLAESPQGLEGCVAGIGPRQQLDRIQDSFAMATRTLHTAQALGLEGAHAFDELALESAVITDTPVGAILHRRYVEPLGDQPGARDIRATVLTYLANELNVERTAEQLIVHQNTVRYRLARFEELLGVKLRDPKTLFGVWWALTATGDPLRPPT